MPLHLSTHYAFCFKAELIVSYLNQMLAFEKNKNERNIDIIEIYDLQLIHIMF